MTQSTKRILLTGVTRGLGRAMVDGFSAAGHTVIGCGRSADAIAELQSDCAAPHHFSVVDVSSDSDVQQWAQTVLTQHGPPDLLLNNAAVINANAPLWEVPADDFDRVTAVNINGIANVVRHFVPAMIAAGSGVIVNFSSGWGRATSPEVAPYCATKWAVEGLTQALAQELPSGMAAVALNPGVINTQMLQSCFGDSAQHYPTAEQWSCSAVPFLLNITPRDNGQPLTAPG